MNSKRTFTIAITSGGAIYLEPIKLEDILTVDQRPGGEAYEYLYALAEIFDQVLDLRPRQSMYFQPNRDDQDSRAIILRTN